MAAARYTTPLPPPSRPHLLLFFLRLLVHIHYPVRSDVLSYVTLRYITLRYIILTHLLDNPGLAFPACYGMLRAPSAPTSSDLPAIRTHDAPRSIANNRNIAIRNLPALSFLNFSHSFPKPTTIRLDLSGARIFAGNLSNLCSETLDFTQAYPGVPGHPWASLASQQTIQPTQVLLD